MAKWEEILGTAKDETKKELTEEIRDLSILSESEIEIVASTDLDKFYLRNIFKTMKNVTITDEEKLDYITSSSGSHLIINLIEKFVC